MNIHKMSLSDAPFEAILRGGKTIESRLYDEKRRSINLGDEIIFSHADNPARQISVWVIGLLRYETFETMFLHNSPKKFGGETVEDLLGQVEKFYSLADQQQFGVLGIEFELLS
jgi:ASC-1-like (ASCH) protein